MKNRNLLSIKKLAVLGICVSFVAGGCGKMTESSIPISMFALSITRTFYIAIFEIVFLGALIMVVSINAKTLFAKIVDKEYIGRVDSYSYTINSLFVSLSGIFAGFLSGIINVSWIFRLYSVVCIIFVICYVTLLNKLQMTSKFRE